MTTVLKFLLLPIFLVSSFYLQSQVTIGYVNMEGVLYYMPESRAMEQELQEYSKVLESPLKVKEDYIKLKYQEYQDLSNNRVDQSQRTPLEQELQKLQQELQQMQQQAESSFLNKERELQQPILERLDAAIKKVAIKEGYTYVLNSMASGSSILLKGPEENNITSLIFQELGMELPE